MRLVGLTGGIGSGKSTVARLLAERGAVVLDADAFAREAIAPGSPGSDEVVDRFGDEVVGNEGELDRARLASIVFADAGARRDLEAIVHPFVRRRIMDAGAARAGTDAVVVVDAPLLIETGTARDCDPIVVVTAPLETQVRRSVARGMDEADVRARIAVQMPAADRAAAADVVIDNAGTLEALEAQVDRLWTKLRAGGR
jgi:dephospho-CoA kinase